jgi:hypothetical protein
MSEKDLGEIPKKPDPKPYKLYRVTQTGEYVKIVGEYATLEEMRAVQRRLDWLGAKRFQGSAYVA